MTIKESKAYKYAEWCKKQENKFVGVYVKKQCQSWLDIADEKSEDAYVDEKSFRKICKILKILIHPDLKCTIYEGLEDYAWLLIVAVFCTKNRKDNCRYYETALLEICRKNFKTFNSAIIFIVGMMTEPQFSSFFSVAPDLKLSKELQKAIHKIIKSSPLLYESKAFQSMRNEVRCKLTESEYIPLAYSQDKMDGKLANMFLADEAGAMDSYPVEAMRSSQITLLNKLGIIISTQYPNDNNVMIDEIDKAKKILDHNNSVRNKRTFALLYEPDEEFTTGDTWQAEDLITYQSNPVAVTHKYIFDALIEKRADAILYPNKRENYLCKHCNIKYKGLGVEGFIDITKVRKCRIENNPEFWKGKRVYIGVDLSQTDDNTAVAMVTFVDGIIYVKVWGFIPKDKLESKSIKENVDYSKFIREGICFACGDEVIDYQFIEQFVIDLPKKYDVEIVQLGFDRYNAISSVQKWEENDIECVEIKQHSSVLHPAIKLLKEYILQVKLQYEENEMLEINFENARCTEDTNLNKYVNKKKSAGKIDMVVSLIDAVYLLYVNEILDNGGGWGAVVV